MTTKAREMEMAEGLKVDTQPSTGCGQSNRARASAGSGICRGAGAMTASCCTFEPGTRRVHRLGLAMGALLLLALCSAAVPESARAQEVVLVQNFAEASADHYDLDHRYAQKFSTGSNAYKINAVQLVVGKTGGSRGMRVQLLEDGPGDAIFTFNSGTITNAFNRFGAPSGANRVLLPNTDYYIGAQQSGGTGNVLTWVGADGNDDTGQSGWSLANIGKIWEGGRWVNLNTSEALKVRIYGERTYPATGAPTITGTPERGHTLTAQTSGIADSDGLNDVSYTYQWIQIDGMTETDIGSDSATYTVAAADTGKQIKVRVSFNDDEGNAESRTSTPVDAVDVENTPATGLIITGSARVGETLTAATSEIIDPNGLTSTTYSYQWFHINGRTRRNISGQTSSTYMPVAADVGKQIGVRVSFADDNGYSEVVFSPRALIRAMMPPATCPAYSTPTGQTQVWRGTVTVAELTNGPVTVAHGYNAGTGEGSLSSPTSFDLSTSYTVDYAGAIGADRGDAAGTLLFSLDNSLTAAEVRRLHLHVCGETYAFADAEYISSAHTYSWPRAGLDWSSLVGSTRVLNLTKSNTAGPTFIPAVNDRYDCIMRESPDRGSVVCNSFHHDRTSTDDAPSGVHASAWAYSATDADGDTVTYSLGGPDADDFNINSATGNVTTKKEASRYNGNSNGGKTVFRVTLEATDDGGLTGTQAAIVTFEDAFEITSLNVNTWIRNGYAVNPRVNVRWDNPWSGGHSTKLKDFEIQYYDTTSPDNYNRESGIDKRKRYFEVKYSLQFDKEYMVRVIATGESRGGLHNVHTDSLDETPWRRFSTGSMPEASGAPGDPLTAAFINAPASHDGSTAFMMQLEFNATLTTGWEALRDSITVTNGTLTRINRVSSLSHLWNLEITPTSESFITIAVAPSGVCDGPNGICAGGRLLEEGVTTKIYGTRAVTTVTNAEISNGPGENGTWDAGESVDVEVTFSSAVTIAGATIEITLDGVRRDAAFAAYIGDTGGRFSYPVTPGDAGATQALLVSNSLDASNGIIGDSGGGDVILDFEGDVAETVEPREEQEPSANALTAQFQNLPDEHEGNEDTFSVQILFDAALSGSWTNVRDAITVTNGTHTGTSRVDGRNDLWRIGVEATSDADVTVNLRASVACGETGALCTSDSRRFETAISTVINGPEEEKETTITPVTPLTASFSGMPSTHNGSTAFKFKVRFSEELTSYSYRTLRDHSVRVTQGGTTTGASSVRRMVQGKNDYWEVTLTPRVCRRHLHCPRSNHRLRSHRGDVHGHRRQPATPLERSDSNRRRTTPAEHRRRNR